MKKIMTLLFAYALSAGAADFSSVIKDSSASQWTGRDAEIGTGPFDEKIISITQKDTKGCGLLSGVQNVQPGERFVLNIEYRSDLANSSKDRGAWIIATWWNPQGQGIKSQFFVLKESSAWSKQSLALDPAPEGANRVNVQLRVQERVGTLSFKSISLTKATAAVTATVDAEKKK